MTMRNLKTAGRLNRRTFICGAAAGLGAVAAGGPAMAQLSGEQREGQIRPIPIAIPEFFSQDPKLGAEIALSLIHISEPTRPY